jgi:tetratricopeptide (TPR) repeat protein
VPPSFSREQYNAGIRGFTRLAAGGKSAAGFAVRQASPALLAPLAARAFQSSGFDSPDARLLRLRMMVFGSMFLPLAVFLATIAEAGPYEDGLKFEATERFDEARQKYAEHLKTAPGDRTAELRLVHVMISAGDLDSAEGRLKTLLAVSPEDPGLLNEQGRLEFNRHRYPEATRMFSAACAADPKLIDAAHNLGVTLQSVGRIEEARVSFRRALSLNPGFVKSLNALAVLEAKQKRIEESLKLLAEAEKLAPGDFETLYNLGIVYGDAEKQAECADYFRRAIAVRPGSAEARNNLGRALVRLKKYEEAGSELAEAVRLAPGLPEPRFNTGLLYEETQKWDLAAGEYRATLAMEPKFAEAAFRLGNLELMKAQEAQKAGDEKEAGARMESARDQFTRAVAANPEYPEALYNLILTLLQEKKFREAAVRARALVRVGPDAAQHHFLLGTAEGQCGNVDAAEKAYRKALKLDSQCTECRLRLASLLYQSGRMPQAGKEYRETLKLDPKNVEANYYLGMVLLRQGELAQSLKAMERTLELKPDNLDALNNAASIAGHQKNMKLAADFIGRSVDLDPAYMPIFRTAEVIYAQAGNVSISGNPKTIRLLTDYLVGFRQFYRDYAAARAAFQRMIETEPRCAIAHVKLGILSIINGKNQEGLAHLAEAGKLAPGDAEIHFARGTAQYNLGERDPKGDRSVHFEEAAAAFQKAIDVSPMYADAYWGKGSSLYRMGRYREARKELEMCLRLNPFFAEAYNTFGSVAAREAELATDPAKRTALLGEAQQLYVQAVRGNPNSEMTHYNLGVIFHNQGKWKEAEAEYQAAIRLNPKLPLPWYRLARMYTDRKGWFDKGRSEEAYRKVLELDPGNCEYLFDFGAFYFNTRQYEKAKEQWRKTLQTCPSHKPARDGLERLIERGY